MFHFASAIFLLTCLSLAGSAFGAEAYIINNCAFNIYASWASATSSSGQTVVSQGGTYGAPIPSGAGLTLKITRDQAATVGVYQVEASDAGGDVWYDLSALNGSPFSDVQRLIYSGAGCPEFVCAPGSSSCEWWSDGSGEHNVGSCPTSDVIAAIC